MAPALRRSSPAPSANTQSGLQSSSTQGQGNISSTRLSQLLRSMAEGVIPLKSIPFYFKHPVFLPSISLAILYLTVLSFSGQMIAFLVFSGYTSIHVGIARTVSTVFELSATWIAPRVMKRIGAVRGGVWFLLWQMLWLAGSVTWFIVDENNGKHTILVTSGLVGGVVLSRIGLWGYDLCAQMIIQDVRLLPRLYMGLTC